MEVKQTNYLMEYEINPDTMAVLPIEIGKNTCSRVLEVEGEYVVAMKPTEIVDRSCRYFGSSLKGRQEGTREIMGVTHKAPIIVEASNKIFYFLPHRQQSKTAHGYLITMFQIVDTV